MMTKNYDVEIYMPGSTDEVLERFEFDAPVMTFQKGDLINTSNWDGSLGLLRVTGIEHILWKSQNASKHRLEVFTELVPDTHDSDSVRLEQTSDKDLLRLLSFVLGQVYRLQNRTDKNMSGTGDGHVYGLLNGLETSIKDQLRSIGSVSDEKYQAVADVLDEIWKDPEAMKTFRGFYDIEGQLQEKGVNRGEAMIILTYMQADGQFTDLIAKMDSSGSPTECRRFPLHELDK